MKANGTVIVSVPHNEAFSKTKGLKPRYPGAYEHVINVGSVQHRYDSPQDNIQISEKSGKPYAASVKYHLGRTGGFSNNDTKNGTYKLYSSSTNNLDTTVDIVAPGNFIFRYNKYMEDGTIAHNPFAATSPAAPLVSGTVGLMFSLNPDLSVDEVNTILKLTSTNIDHIQANAPFRGLYGAGSLHTGRAVKFTHDMLKKSEYAVVENQYFTRWKFEIEAAQKIKIKNQTFQQDAVVDFNAQEEILVQEESVFLPAHNGSIILTVDPTRAYKTQVNTPE
jgi:subtilisin family serine protease